MAFDADSGPNLLLDWQQETGSVRWLRDGVASLAVHAILVPLLILVASLETPPPKEATEIVSNLHHVTLITPRDITQKEPNRAKPAKEVNVEDLLPHPPTQKREPATPAVRAFQPPQPRAPGPPRPGSDITDPPKLEASVNPPQPLPAPAGIPNAPPKIQTEEQPKLALDAAGQRGANEDSDKGKAKLASPKLTMEEAIHQMPKGGGNPTSPSISDLSRPDLPASPQLPPSPASQGILPELLSDPKGVDFKPYLAQVLALVRRNWFAIIPESARHGGRGLTVLEFEIDRNGGVPKLVIATTSGSRILDNAAVAAISATNAERFPPLPTEFKGLAIRLRFAFKYNVQ
ncbi:MAG TPA: TonB family protein [Bryobacteraceae bacterium]|nr:TonB family protein [Bryobacteraceae bacterium]